MKKFYLLFISLLVLATSIQAQSYNIVFAKQFIPVPNAEGSMITQSKIDAHGNMYVIGDAYYEGDAYAGRHLFVTKISNTGIKQWTRHISESGDSADEAKALAIDSLGNVYVTGARLWFTQFCDEESCQNYFWTYIITMKFDSLGNEIWFNNYNIPGDQITPADIDLAKDGNIFITANVNYDHYEEETNFTNNLLIQTINKNGETIGTQLQPAFIGISGCLDNDGNFLVAGATKNFAANPVNKATLLKFSANRELIWSVAYENNSKTSAFYQITFDSLNNMYVNGRTNPFIYEQSNYIPLTFVVKYNASGTKQWVVTRNANVGSRGFLTDLNGNTYITATVFSGTVDNSTLSIIKYNNDGVLQWVSKIDSVYGLPLIEKNGKLIVTTSPFSGTNKIIVYNSLSGKQIFKKQISHNLSTAGFDDMNNVYLVGSGVSLPNDGNIINVAKLSFVNSGKPNSVQQQQLNISLYPNPATTSLNVSFTSSIKNKNYKCFVYDVNGNLYTSANMNDIEGKYIAQLNTANLHSGLYSVKISDGINVESRTFLKQ